jgi:peptide/nickel transport system ATP-binding protein
MKNSNVLTIQNLSLFLHDGVEKKKLLHDISFAVSRGEMVAIIGESGSGKTLLTRAITNLFPEHSQVFIQGKILFNENELLKGEWEMLNEIRKKSIRYIFQEPASALNPVLNIGVQCRLLLGNAFERENSTLVVLLSQLGIENPARVLDSYPHQLSVGMLQRVLIAIAIASQPEIIIADEPTSSVDAVLRYQIHDLLSEQCKKNGIALLLTTHDLDVVIRYADKIIMLYDGRIFEKSSRQQFFSNPLHPYSQLLLQSLSDLKTELENKGNLKEELEEHTYITTGCRFSTRCPKAQPDCFQEEPMLISVEEGNEVRCPYWK